MASANNISLVEFKDALGRYPALIKSMTKPAKPGVLTLEELDTYRYVDAPAQFSKTAGSRTMELGDVQKLVDWKLRHGTFRPTLPKLVASNSVDLVREATTDAFAQYDSSTSDISRAIKKLVDPLKGVGPATASLLLAVHDPDHVIFFSDEVYRWLCADGADASPKYNIKEFDDLFAKAKSLMSRLGVSALDIEKVAYVLMKESDPVAITKPAKEKSDKPKGRPAKPDSEKAKKPTVPGRGRGRPPKIEEPGSVKSAKVEAEPKKKGRPPKAKTEKDLSTSDRSPKRKVRESEAEQEEGTARRQPKKVKA